MTEELTLLDHYVGRGAEPWNVSLEAAWLDYELRAWVKPRLPCAPRVRGCNIGIGVGLWDDWLAYELAGSLTSVDRDPEICRMFRIRQRRERHPHPSTVVCGDAARGALGRRRFDVVTIVGSTLDETGDRDQLEHAARLSLVDGGVLLIADVGNQVPPPADDVRRLDEIWIAFRAWSAAAPR